jgi:hypothetical protein
MMRCVYQPRLHLQQQQQQQQSLLLLAPVLSCGVAAESHPCVPTYLLLLLLLL